MKTTRLDTRIHLVYELEKLPKTAALQEIIDEAKAGEFHDYKNNKYVCGKVAAVMKLTEIGLTELADRVRNGDFDEEPDEEDKAQLREYLKDFKDAPGIIKKMGLQ